VYIVLFTSVGTKIVVGPFWITVWLSVTVWTCGVGDTWLGSCADESGAVEAVGWLADNCVGGSLLLVYMAGELNAVGWLIDEMLLLEKAAGWLEGTLPVEYAESELASAEPPVEPDPMVIVRAWVSVALMYGGVTIVGALLIVETEGGLVTVRPLGEVESREAVRT